METRQTVKKILEGNGVFAYVAEEEVTAGRDILCKICERILSSNFGVVELTQRNPNVMFEFGFLLASQKPVFVLYNKALAEKIKAHPPADISALERIEYYNQEGLYERFLKGLTKYIDEQYPTIRREKEKKKALVDASSEDLNLILEALKSNNDIKRLESTRDLLLLSYDKRIIHDKRVLEIIKRSLNDANDKIRGEFLEILKIILRVEDDAHRKSLTENFLEKVIEISLRDVKIEVRRRAFDLLEDTNNPKIIGPCFKAIRDFNRNDWGMVKSNVIGCLRVLYRDDYCRTITQKLYTLLDEPNLQDRVREILERLRAR
jgi:nucleoside 2-deoxyribosyltransferase